LLAALRSEGVDAHAFDPAERELLTPLREIQVLLHRAAGRFGQDGTAQGALR
jgi:D-alanine-D-alanine ligase